MVTLKLIRVLLIALIVMLGASCAKREPPSTPTIHPKALVTKKAEDAFPLKVTAKLYQDLYDPMVIQRSPCPEYIASLVITNMGQKTVTYNQVVVLFANPSTDYAMRCTIVSNMGSDTEDDSGIPDVEKAKKTSLYKLDPLQTHETEVETNGYTEELLDGLEPGMKIELFVIFIVGKDEDIAAAYMYDLPMLGELPSKYSDDKIVKIELEKLESEK